MNFYAILPLLSFIANIFLGFYVIYNNPKNKLNKLYAFFTFSLALWSIGSFFTFISATPELALIWDKVATIGSSTNSAFLLHFFFVFTEKKVIKKKINIVFLYLPVFFFGFINLFTDFIAIFAKPAYWGYEMVPGKLFYPLAFYVATYAIIGLFLCYKFIIKTISVNKKIQAKFLIVGIGIPVVGGIVTQVLLPFFNITIIPLTSTLTTVTAIIIAYAIMKYGLLTISTGMAADIIMRAMADYIIVINGNQIITLANTPIIKRLEQTKEEIIGRPLSEILNKSEKLMAKLANKAIIYDYECAKQSFIHPVG